MNFNQSPYIGSNPYYYDPYGGIQSPRYSDGFNDPAQNPFAPQPRQQSPMGGMNPLQGLQMYQKFAGGGGGGGSAAPAGGGGAGGGGWLSSAGPWAALAAAIAANETWANQEGRRPDDFGDHVVDLFSGKVLEYDADALADEMPGWLGEATEFGGKLGNPEGIYEVLETGVGNLLDLFGL